VAFSIVSPQDKDALMKNQLLVGLLVCAFAHGVCSGSDKPDMTVEELKALMAAAGIHDEEDSADKAKLDAFFTRDPHYAAALVAEALVEDTDTGADVIEYCINNGQKDVLANAWGEAKHELNDDGFLGAYLTAAEDAGAREIAKDCRRALGRRRDDRDGEYGSDPSSGEEGYGCRDSDDDSDDD